MKKRKQYTGMYETSFERIKGKHIKNKVPFIVKRTHGVTFLINSGVEYMFSNISKDKAFAKGLFLISQYKKQITDYYNDNRIWIRVDINALIPGGIGYQETQRYVIETKESK